MFVPLLLLAVLVISLIRSSGPAPLYLDVRHSMEYRWGHIASSRNIPLHQLKSRLSELDDWRDHEIVVVCETGERSKQAVEQLREAGFHRVRNLVGGARGLV